VVGGANEGSPNYVKDLVIDIGAGWWHENTHAHSRWNDLNRDGMNYTLPGQEEVPLFRVSKQQALQLFFETGRQQDVSSWLRSMPVQRSVFVAHDYFPFFFQVENDTGNYSVLPSHGDVQNTSWSAIRPKSDFVNGTWSALPSFVAMLDLLSSYDVWYAPVRDVYDRSCLVQNVMLQETGTQVILTNLNQVEVKGLTLFTRGQPNYLLFDGITPLSVQQGSAGSWHFVIDLEPGEVLVLDKLSAEARPLSVTSYVDTPYMAVRETWPGAL
jgi:hypothetical protein